MNQILNTKLHKNVNQILSTEKKKNINQILSTNFMPNEVSYPSYLAYSAPIQPKKKNWFKFQFAFSIFIIILAVLCGEIYFYSLKKQEELSNDLIANYNIYRLYSTYKDNSEQEAFNGLFRNYRNTKN